MNYQDTNDFAFSEHPPIPQDEVSVQTVPNIFTSCNERAMEILGASLFSENVPDDVKMVNAKNIPAIASSADKHHKHMILIVLGISAIVLGVEVVDLLKKNSSY